MYEIPIVNYRKPRPELPNAKASSPRKRKFVPKPRRNADTPSTRRTSYSKNSRKRKPLLETSKNVTKRSQPRSQSWKLN